jgi:hypothetical protein
MSTLSLNNRLIVESYKDPRVHKSLERNGFAMLSQKITLKGLKVLVPFKKDDLDIPTGSIAYIREELLYTQAWAKQVFECDEIKEPFIIIDSQYVEFIKKPETV